MKKPRAYQIRYSIEQGEWYPPVSERDKKPHPEIRILQSKGKVSVNIKDLGYADDIALCSIVGVAGEEISYAWFINPDWRKKELDELLGSLEHQIKTHTHYHD